MEARCVLDGCRLPELSRLFEKADVALWAAGSVDVKFAGLPRSAFATDVHTLEKRLRAELKSEEGHVVLRRLAAKWPVLSQGGRAVTADEVYLLLASPAPTLHVRGEMALRS